MVVCKCRKATKLYCFVHKTPLCLDCICSPEHAVCVVGLYSEWVNDGDYDWPPKCPVCNDSLEDSSKPTTRLGCLHVVHTECLEKHLASFPPYTAPAGYVCPTCSVPIWPPKSQKDAATTLYTSIRTLLSKSPAAGVLLAGATTPPADSPLSEEKPPPPAFATSPLVHGSTAVPFGSPAGNPGADVAPLQKPEVAGNGHVGERAAEPGLGSGGSPPGSGNGVRGPTATSEIQVAAAPPPSIITPSTSAPPPSVHSPQKKSNASHQQQNSQPGAIPRKPSFRPGDRVAIDITPEYSHHHLHHHHQEHSYEDDEDGTDRKYARRGPLYMQLLRHVASFWAPALQALPITSKPSRKEERDAAAAEELVEGRARRRHHAARRSVVDPRKLLLFIAIGSCMATMMLLYFRLAQGTLSGSARQGGGGAQGR